MGYRGVFLEWIEQWSQLRPGYNWRTFQIIQIEVEDDRSMGGAEATVVLLGLGFRIRVNYAKTPMVDHIEEQVQRIKDGEKLY
jgi:hypothetical protein